ncbi:AMP-binding protein [Aeromicrobium massiliense]|uniref:AMP-binding protein n=1 Tax=Aeromicrobium massiliense TaxID=1464554 RepID=UPI0002F8AE8B|nr:AMP-binding protein [Aeromicrobium massiliense]
MGRSAGPLTVLHRIGMLRPQAPHRMLAAGRELLTWGPGLPSGVHANAHRAPQQVAIADDAGQTTWRELADDVDRFSAALRARGVGEGDAVAVLCRNHRYMVQTLVAAMQVGAKVLLLNTMASGRQLEELVQREGAVMVVLDEEFLGLCAPLDRDMLVLAWSDGGTDLPTVSSLAAAHPAKRVRKPKRHGQIIIFTSGTTGAPKGSRREEPKNLRPILTFFGAIPYEAGATVLVAAPLFHSWGLLNFGFGLIATPTYVMRRRFDPAQTVRDVAEHRASVLVAVPIMLQRMADLPEEATRGLDVSSLRITATSGSALAGDLAIRFMDRFTDSIYNFYGATETAWVTIASPEHLRAAPGTAGVPPRRTTVKVLGPDGREVPQGETGVIHVGNDMPFGGYTDGRTKEFAAGLMSTGDVGHLDEAGRLFVSGRDDEMIVSGGENVFPRELEDALAEHPAVAEVVVTGVPDEQWGQTLAAYVVVRDGHELDHAGVVDHAKQHVARFAVPRHVVFLDELPRNPTGKVMRRELPPHV